MITICRCLLPLLVLAAVLRAEDAPTADSLWKKTDDAISALKKRPENPPKTREESIERFKKLVTAADEAGKEFTTKFPTDPRRWKIRLFEGMTAGARTQLGMKQEGDMNSILAEVVAAPDAVEEDKGEASAVLVLVASTKAEAGGDSGQWLQQAEAHLKKYPNAELNTPIKSKMDGIKMLAELKTKPLDIKFKSVDGREVDLSQMRGKVVLIDFWATWCGPCVAEVPNVVKTYEKLHPKGFEIVGISLDSDKEKLESFTKDKQMSWPQFFDGKGWSNEIASKFGIHSIPAMWLVNKKGIVVSTSARGELEKLVEKELAE